LTTLLCFEYVVCWMKLLFLKFLKTQGWFLSTSIRVHNLHSYPILFVYYCKISKIDWC
jgi:hypothetical protein